MSDHFGLLLCDVPQSKDGLNVNIQGEGSSSSGESRQYLHDGFTTSRMASITQNFENNNSFLKITLGNRLDQQVVHVLLKAKKR